MLGTQHVRAFARRQLQKIRQEDFEPDYLGLIQQLVSEPCDESQDKRYRPVWAGPLEDSVGSFFCAIVPRAGQGRDNQRR